MKRCGWCLHRLWRPGCRVTTRLASASTCARCAPSPPRLQRVGTVIASPQAPRVSPPQVIPYIASQFRKDKIWLRRTRPSKRQYQVMLAIDDSQSMADNRAGQLACEALVTICKAMSKLEVRPAALIVRAACTCTHWPLVVHGARLGSCRW